MSLTIQLPQETERRVRERAAITGVAPELLVGELIETGLAAPTLDDDLAEFRKAILASGESEAQTAAFMQGVVDQVRAERQTPAPRK